MHRHVLLLVLLSLLTFFSGLGRGAIADSDEAYYAEASREMVESGDWITPYFNYEHRFQKPILYYWLASLTYVAAGVSAFAARLPSAMSGLGLVLLAWACTRRWYDDRTALLAGAIVATSVGYFAMARQSLPDLPLAFFVSLATWAGMRAVGEAGDRAEARRWLIGAAAAAAAGMLMKGPLGLLLPAIVIAPVMWIQRRRNGLFGHTRLADWAVAAAVFTAISVPWYAAMYQRHGQPYLEGFFIGDNFERFAEPERFNERRPFYYYWPPIIGAGLMPWTAFLLLGIGPIRAAWQQRSVPVAVTRLVIWTAMPLAFFSLSYGKQPRYILPILPPLAILIARAITARLASRPSGDWLLRTCGAATGLAILTLAALIARARPLFDAHAHASGTAAVMVGLGAAAVLAATFQWPTRLPAAIAAAGALTIGALQFGVLTRGGVEPVERMAQHVTDPDHPARYWASFDVFNRNLVFYAREKQTQLMSEDEVVQFLSLPDRVLLVIPADALARIERERSIKTRRLAAERYFNPSGIKIRTLLWPDPERDLDHVLLVANQ